MHRRRDATGRQARRDDSPDRGERRRDLDADLDIRNVVQIEHDVAVQLKSALALAVAHTSLRRLAQSRGNSSQVVDWGITAVTWAATTDSVTV